MRVDCPAIIQVALSLNPDGTEGLVIEIASRAAERYRVAVCCLEDKGS
jgi:hypothetical protein